jgi:hypothetical protein
MEGQSHSENISTRTAGGRIQPANGNARIAYKSLTGVIVGWARVVRVSGLETDVELRAAKCNHCLRAGMPVENRMARGGHLLTGRLAAFRV